VLAVVWVGPDAVDELFGAARVSTADAAPWSHDTLGHDTVCVASPREPEHDVTAPPLTDAEVTALVARIDDLLEA
jgi:hypothetical protein